MTTTAVAVRSSAATTVAASAATTVRPAVPSSVVTSAAATGAATVRSTATVVTTVPGGFRSGGHDRPYGRRDDHRGGTGTVGTGSFGRRDDKPRWKRNG